MRLSNEAMRSQLCFRMHIPIAVVQHSGEECGCHRNHDERQRADARRKVREGSRKRKRGRRRPGRVDGQGDHDMVCPLGNSYGRHAAVQATHYSLLRKDAGLMARTTTCLDIHTDADPRSQKQADLAVDGYGEEETTAVIDYVITHPTGATHSNKYGQSGDAAETMAKRKVDKYQDICDEAGVTLIPFAMETYGKMCGSALQHLKTAQRMQAAASGDLSLRPWYERDFTTKAKQRLGVALQRSIYERQLLRSSKRRRSPSPSADSSSDDY